MFLAGGGDENQSFEVDRDFTNRVKNVVYIPLAYEKDPAFHNCKKWFRSVMNKFGVENITTITNLDQDFNLEEFDGIYIGGGNTFKLLKLVKESGFDKKLIDFHNRGGIIYGGSAGAIFLEVILT